MSLNKDKTCFAWEHCPKPLQTPSLQFKFHLFLFLNFPLSRIFPFVSCFGSVSIQHFFKYCIHYIYFICIIFSFQNVFSSHYRCLSTVKHSYLTNGKLFVSICEHYTLFKLWCSPGVNTGTSSIFFIYAPTWSHDTETQHLSPLLCGWYTAVSPINGTLGLCGYFISYLFHK